MDFPEFDKFKSLAKTFGFNVDDIVKKFHSVFQEAIQETCLFVLKDPEGIEHNVEYETAVRLIGGKSKHSGIEYPGEGWVKTTATVPAIRIAWEKHEFFVPTLRVYKP